MNPQQLIQRHAYLQTGIQRTLAAGKQPPPNVLMELQRIESKAQAMFTPMELQQAQAASQSIQAQLHHTAEVQAAQTQARDKSYYSAQLSKSLTGMTPDQLIAAKRGEKIPVKGKSRDPRKFKQSVENTLRGLGAQMTFDQFEKAADRVEEIVRSGKSPAKYLKENFGNRAAEAGDLIAGYNSSGVGLAIGLAELREPDVDHYEMPTDDLSRRAEIADAWARRAKGDVHDFEAITADIHPSYLNDTSQGDVARAMLQHEREAQTQERENWSAPEYDIKDEEAQGYVSAF